MSINEKQKVFLTLTEKEEEKLKKYEKSDLSLSLSECVLAMTSAIKARLWIYNYVGGKHQLGTDKLDYARLRIVAIRLGVWSMGIQH